jgi:hypothetical protein
VSDRHDGQDALEAFDWELEAAKEAGIEAHYELLNRREARSAGEDQPKLAPRAQTSDRWLRILPPGAYVVETVDAAMELWARHERQEPSRWYRPDGPSHSTPRLGVPASRQAFVYVRDVAHYRRAYPVLWWVYLRHETPETFSAREFLAMRGELVRDEALGRRRLGWRLPDWRTGPRVRGAAEILALFVPRLEAQLRERPLVIVPMVETMGTAEIGETVVESVERTAERKWGIPPESLRDARKSGT